MGMVEGAIAALVMERDMSAWAIGFDSRLLAAVYSVSTTLCKCHVRLCDSLSSSKANVNPSDTGDYSQLQLVEQCFRDSSHRIEYGIHTLDGGDYTNVWREESTRRIALPALHIIHAPKMYKIKRFFLIILSKTYEKYHEQGVVCSGIAYYVQGVVNKVRGPVFVTAFSPLCMIITAVVGAIVLAEKMHLGRYTK